MSLMQFNNLSFLTYGAIGLTGVILAVATAYETPEGGSESESSESSAAPIPVAEPIKEEPSSLFGSQPEGEGEGEGKESNSLFGSQSEGEGERKEEAESFYDAPDRERVGGKKKKKRRTKKQRGGKKARKTKNKKQKHKKTN